MQKKKRLSAFEIDRSHWNDYDYVIVNDNLEICFSQIEKIIVSHKNKKLI
jgi:guanylate kinase